jgi:hypothetical protein
MIPVSAVTTTRAEPLPVKCTVQVPVAGATTSTTRAVLSSVMVTPLPPAS